MDNRLRMSELKIKSGLLSKREVLMKGLKKFYNDDVNMKKLLGILEGSKEIRDGKEVSIEKISLRLVDWFVTNYSKKNNIHIIYKQDRVSVHLDYKSQLKAFSKKLFDPFCRRERILFDCGEDKQLETTVGQLNFFKWFINKDYLSYVRENKEKIEKDMNFNAKDNTKTSKTPKNLQGLSKKVENTPISATKKADNFSISAVKTETKHKVKIVVDFV